MDSPKNGDFQIMIYFPILLEPEYFIFKRRNLKGNSLKLKFSSHLSPYVIHRPSLLGDNLSQRIFKDYNGQTYWLTFDFNNKNPREGKKFLNI